MCEGKILKQTYKLCPHCGNFINSEIEDKFCYLCGTPYIDKCPRCSESIIYPLAKECPACGYKIINKENSQFNSNDFKL